MIDPNKVTSGYDAELILGETVFKGILDVLLGSGEIPDSFSIDVVQGLLSISIDPDYDLAFGSVDDGAVLMNSTFNIGFGTPIGNFDLNNLTLTLRFDFYLDKDPGADTGVVGLELRIDHLDVPWLRTRLPVEYREYAEKIVEALCSMFYYKGTTGLSGSLVQDLSIRGFNETGSHKSAVGLYFSYPFTAEPDGTLHPSRGDVGNAQCLLETRDHGVALAINKQVYPMMDDHITNMFAEQKEDGTYEFPIYQDMENKRGRVGHVKNVSIYPRWHRDFSELWGFGVNPSDIRDEIDQNALYLIVQGRWKMYGFDGDAYVRLKIALITDPEGVSYDITLDDIHVEEDDEYAILKIIAGGFVGFFASLFGGFIGLAIAGVIGYMLADGVFEYFTGEAESKARSGIEGAIESAVTPIRTIPNRMSILKKRWDPFFYLHHQLVYEYDQCEILEDGIFYSGKDYRHSTQDELFVDVKPIGVTRNGDGEIVDLVYKVGKPEEVVDPEKKRRRTGAPPGEYLLSVIEAEDRCKFGRLRRMIYMYPTHIYRRNNQIKYIQFHTGLVLTPQEAIELERKHIIYIAGGYRRIYRRGTFYLRTRADITEVNNLGNMPRFHPNDAFMPLAED